MKIYVNEYDCSMYRTYPFRGHYFNEFFECISQAFLLLEYLTFDSLMAQEKKSQIESINDKKLISSTISSIYPVRARFIHAHIDYANQFLNHQINA